MRISATVSVAALGLVLALVSHGRETSPLAQHGIEPTEEAIGAFLISFLNEDDEREQFAAAIGRLNDMSFKVRQNAARWLLNARVVHFDLLERAVASPDPEVRLHAKSLMDRLKKRPPDKRRDDALLAVASFIEWERMDGLADELLMLIPTLAEPLFIRRTTLALKATARDADLGLLRGALSHESPAARMAALKTLASLLGERIADDASDLLADPTDPVRLEAAHTLANLGDRGSLPVLLDLLRSDDAAVRARSAHVLRQLSGQRFGFSSRSAPEARAAAVGKWSEWVAGEGKASELRFPVPEYTVDTRGLMLHFAFDREGDAIVDNSGRENHGVAKNASHSDGGRVGGGRRFDGQGDYLTVPNSESLELRDNITLAVWVKLDSFGPGGYGNEEGHIVKKGDPLWWNPGFGLGYRKTNGVAKFVIGHPDKPTTGGGVDLKSKTVLKPRRWHHLVGTYDGKVAKFFIDGRLDVEADYAGKIRPDGAPVMVGGGKLFSPDEFANHFAIHGTVDELRIYNRALSADEVDLLYQD